MRRAQLRQFCAFRAQHRAHRRSELGVVEWVIATQQRQDDLSRLLFSLLPNGYVDQCLDLPVSRRATRKCHQIFDGAHARRRELLDRQIKTLVYVAVWEKGKQES